jgi:hypothetical protein
VALTLTWYDLFFSCDLQLNWHYMLCLCLAGGTHQNVSPYCYDPVELELTMLCLCLGGEIHWTAISLLKNCRQ